MRNLILSITCEFYYDDVTVTSFINIKYGDVAVEVVRSACSVLLFISCGQKDLPHSPYSPELAPSDYHLFEPMKKALGGQKFASVSECYQSFISGLDIQHRSLLTNGTNV